MLIKNLIIKDLTPQLTPQVMKKKHALIGDVRGRGCLFGAELVKDRHTKEPATDEAEKVLYKALEQGLSFKTTMGNVLTFTPPLIITEDQMHQAMDIIDRCLTEVEKENRTN